MKTLNKEQRKQKRDRKLRDKNQKYFMENKTGMFRLRIIESDKSQIKKIKPTNLLEFIEDDT